MSIRTIDSVLNATTGENVKTNTLGWGSNTIVGIYFSAHWCSPCRTFTEDLIKYYNSVKAKVKDNGVKLEIVFVSLDEDEQSFNDYLKMMPWLAYPYEWRQEKEQLVQEFKVEGIPALIFVDGRTGHVLSMDGRDLVMNDPEGCYFPDRIRRGAPKTGSRR